MYGAFVAVVGIDALRRFLPVFIALLMSIPVPGVIRDLCATGLQSVTATVFELLAASLSIPYAVNDGSLVFGPMTLERAVDWNGMRLLYPMAVVAYGVAFAMPIRAWQRAAVCLAVPFVVVLANVLQIAGLVAVLNYTSSDTAIAIRAIGPWVIMGAAALAALIAIYVRRATFLPISRSTSTQCDSIRGDGIPPCASQ